MTADPAGVVPVAVPMLVMLPRSTSAWVVVYVAVQTTDAPGASAVTPLQSTADRPGIGSPTVTEVSVTLPLLVTR